MLCLHTALTAMTSHLMTCEGEKLPCFPQGKTPEPTYKWRCCAGSSQCGVLWLPQRLVVHMSKSTPLPACRLSLPSLRSSTKPCSEQAPTPGIRVSELIWRSGYLGTGAAEGRANSYLYTLHQRIVSPPLWGMLCSRRKGISK